MTIKSLQTPLHHLTFNPNINSCSNSKHKEEKDEDKSLQVVCRHSLHPKQDGPQQFTLKSNLKIIFCTFLLDQTPCALM